MTYKDKYDQRMLAIFGLNAMQGLALLPDGIERLKRVFLASTIGPQDVIAVAKKKRLVSGLVDRAIYEDILFALYYEVLREPGSKVIDAMYEEIQAYIKEASHFLTYQKFVRCVKNDKEFDFGVTGTIKSSFCFSLIYDGVLLSKIAFHEFSDYMFELERGKCLEMTKHESSDNLLDGDCFEDEQCVVGSKVYQQYMDSLTQELVVYLSQRYKETVIRENLADFICEKIHFGLFNGADAEDVKVDTVEWFDGAVITGISWLGVSKYSFSMDMLPTLMGDATVGSARCKDYHPDINHIIEVAMHSFIAAYFRQNEETPISRGVIRKEILPYVTENIAALYNNIVNLYYIDCVYKVVEHYRDEYYYAFPWFYDAEKAEVAQPEAPVILSDMKGEKEAPITEPAVDNSYLELNARYEHERKRSLEVGRKFAHEIAERDKALADSADEMERLKNKIQSQQEYIELLTAAEEVDVEEESDISSLYGKRFLFVGKVTESYPDLKRTFPNSIFMESETLNLKNIQVDAVVFLVRHMGHPAYHKVMQDAALTSVKKIYCNNRNINNVYRSMLNGMGK